MKSFKVLVLGVILPGALSAALYGAMNDDHRTVRVERDVRVDVDVDEIMESVEAELAAVEAEVAAGTSVRGCDHARTEVVRLGAADLAALRVTAGAGDLVVTGRDGSDEVVVRSTMCASSEDLLRGLRTGLAGEGDEAVVTTDYPRSAGFGRRYARIDLEIDVPLGMAADLEDSSGALAVRGTGETRISDGSGAIEVRATAGGVTIRDGSGEIELRDIGGDVEVVDGSGELVAFDVAGSIALTDGSGTVELRGVEGNVEVRADGSGDIVVADVGGDFTVRADGSGGVSHTGVAGAVRVPRKR